MSRKWNTGFVLGAVGAVALAACTPKPETAPAPAAPAEAAPVEVAAATPAPLVAEGEAYRIEPDASEDIQSAASVVKVDFLENQDTMSVKLFGTAGGDPAANGLYTYLAFYMGPADDWEVYMIGDFIDYRVLSDAPGRVDLEIQESTMNEETGELGSLTRRLIVSWTLGSETAEISVTPAK
jgi:hypothetical protein